VSDFFVTGTDTDVGKTWVSVSLLLALQQRGTRAVGMKPVAAGCDWHDGHWINADAQLLQRYSQPCPDYHCINPYAFEMAQSPHLACGNTVVTMSTIQSAFAALKAQADCVVVEGAGGWLSPLSQQLDNADCAKGLNLPVIVAVAVRLGCINHARLTVAAIAQAGLNCVGWVAVERSPRTTDFDGNVAYLRQCLGVPLLGVLPHLPCVDFEFLARQLCLNGIDS
jgi:dethiobiotin synthetase